MTVDDLARHKRLPVEFLHELRVHDIPGGGVAIPYYGPTGEDLFTRERESARRPGKRFWQPAGVPTAPYGQWRLDHARRAGFLPIVEGESGCWALWHQGLPALGLPGSLMAGCLNRECLEAIDKIYIHREPDAGGAAFVTKVAERLAALGFEGQVYELRMPDGVKDPADLHAADPARFTARIQDAIIGSKSIPISKPAQEATDAVVPIFPAPIPASELRACNAAPWIWQGCLSRGGVTLLSALWKSGKTTLLAHLVRSLEEGGHFCGLPLEPGRVLYITEESETRWAERRDALGLHDHIDFLIRPFGTKPHWDGWVAFLSYLQGREQRQACRSNRFRHPGESLAGEG